MQLYFSARPTVHTNPSQKRSSISTVRPTVHANPLRKRGFISTVKPTVHTNPSLKRSFSKTPFKREEFENAALSFRVGRKPDPVFLKHKSKMTNDCCVLKFLPRGMDGKHLMRFQSETSVFKFLLHSVDGKHLMRF